MREGLKMSVEPQNSSSLPTVAILGATGLVGSHLMAILEARKTPLAQLKLLASERSVGQMKRFHGQDLNIELACPEAFDGVDLVLASAGGQVSAALAPEAVKRGAVVVDNTSHFRLHPNVPLVVAGVNNEVLAQHQGIVANPNCSTAQLMPVLKALHQAAGLKRVIVSTYQSVSGSGASGLEDLIGETASDLNENYHADRPEHLCFSNYQRASFQRPIAFNLIPQIDVFSDDDYTKEELKLIRETQKILALPNLPVTATAVRVPVLVGHSEAVTLEFERPITPAEAADVLRQTPDVVVADKPEAYHTPRETAGTDPVYVSRIRKDTSNPETGLNLFVVSDNLRIGAALNAVRLAEQLTQDQLLRVPAGASF
jgi:aspartate-semialdehyde dehydrogenase